MIQMLISLGKWLESRFPKRKVVGEAEFAALITRIESIENNAVHKEPVKLLVEEMAKFKAELASLRAGLGITASASSPEAMEAMLNGVMLGKGDQNA